MSCASGTRSSPFPYAARGGADYGQGVIAAREVRLAEREVLLNTKERDISSREGNLEATLRGKDEELEALVQ